MKQGDLLISKFITSITDKKLREKLTREKPPIIKTTVEFIPKTATTDDKESTYVTTPVRVVVLYISDYFCCFFEGHSSFLASLDENLFGFINFELNFAE